MVPSVILSEDDDPFNVVVTSLEDDPSSAVVVVSSLDVTVVGLKQFFGSNEDPGQFMDPENTLFCCPNNLYFEPQQLH